MPIDFRLLSDQPYTQPISTMLQVLQMKQQKEQQDKQIASQEAQTVYTTEAQRSENAINRQQNAEQSRVSNILGQYNKDREYALDVAKAEDISARDTARLNLDTQRLGLDVAKEDFNQQMSMAKNNREQDMHSWTMYDKASQQLIQDQLGQAFQKGGFGAAAQVMGRYGMTSDAQQLMIQQRQYEKIGIDIQNSILDGQKSLGDIEDQNRQRKAYQISEAASATINDIAATRDPVLRDQKLARFATGLSDLTGQNYDDLVFTPEGQQVFMKSLMDMKSSYDQHMQGKIKDPQRSLRDAQMIEAAFSDNPYFDGFATGFMPTSELTDVDRSLNAARQAEARGDTEAATLNRQAAQAKAQSQQGTTINVPGVNPQTGEVVFPTSQKTQSDIDERLVTNQVALRDLDRIKENMNTQLLEIGPRLGTKVATIADFLGVSTESQKDRITAVESFMTPVEQFFNTYRKNITGAAASEKELKMLRDTFINRDISPTQFEARFNSIMDRTQTELSNATKEKEQGGLSGKPTQKSLQYSRDELIAEAQRRGLSWQ